mmetsp:Transcript_5310/g.13553  ORF Transcript_5310/g.13553 Transcript_5310/m.13553 type:complete len:335 (+) Transcript_5310:80-1084(+)
MEHAFRDGGRHHQEARPLLPLREVGRAVGALVRRAGHLVRGREHEPRPSRPEGQVLQRLLPLAAARVGEGRRHMAADRHSLHLARRPGRDRLRADGAHHADARGGARRALLQHPDAFAALLAGARAHLRRVRRAAVDVPRLARRRRRVAVQVRHQPRGRAAAVEPYRGGRARQASVRGDGAALDARRPLLREGAVRDAGGRAERRVGAGARRQGRGAHPGRARLAAAALGAAPALRRGVVLLPRLCPRGDGRPPNSCVLHASRRLHRGQPQSRPYLAGGLLASGQLGAIPAVGGAVDRLATHGRCVGGDAEARCRLTPRRGEGGLRGRAQVVDG